MRSATRAQFLQAWLDGLAEDGRPRVLLGGTGHLILTPDEEAQAAVELERTALPQLGDADPEAEILVLTGLAPGADVLFTEVAAAWLAHHGRSFRRVGVLPVPTEVLWGDWLTRSGVEDGSRIATMRERFDRAVRDSDTLIQLWEDTSPDWADAAARQRQYRRLGALLVEQCELLVAVLKPRHPGQPGGAAEVVTWREQPASVPPELANGARRHRSGWPAPDRLIRIDPTVAARSATAGTPWVRSVQEALRSGNYLLAYDRVLKAEAQQRPSDELVYLKLLALANAGSTQAALRRFEELPQALRERNEDWLALEGRLYKDLALRGGPAAPAHFRRAAECYRAAFVRTGGYFSAINAATTSLLGGERSQAAWLAQDVLAHVERLDPADETERYYVRATEAEAALLLADVPRARSALEAANRLLPDNLNARSRTRQQLALLCRELRLDAGVVQVLRMPPVVYLPPTADRGAAPVAGADLRAAFVYAGLTQPPELERAERLLDQDVRLHAVLAAPRKAMLAHWHDVHGREWGRRLGAVIDRAHETSVALGFLPSEDLWCDSYVGAMALGLSRLAARRLGSEWRCPGPDGALQPGGARAELDQAVLDVLGYSARSQVGGVVFDRLLAGVIFADFAGFSRLGDDELPLFWANFMRAISERLGAHRPGILLQHTWGDALHVVTRGARAAAEIACEIQDCLEHLRPTLPGALASLELRLAAHFAPVFSGGNPIEEERTYFGTQLSVTARIEPVTPPGMIFVTEAFAAQITLESPENFVVEYAGEVSLAKSWGQSRLFNLRRRAS